MTFLLYLVGAIAFISGAAWIATLIGVGQVYVTGAAAILLALAVVSGVAYARGFATPPQP